MIPPLALQLSDSTQETFLYELLDSKWPSEVLKIGSFEELKQLIRRRRFGLVYLQLSPGSDEELDWLRTVDDPVVGVVSHQWSADQLEKYIDHGLEDYVIKPFQPPKLHRQLEARLKSIRAKEG